MVNSCSNTFLKSSPTLQYLIIHGSLKSAMRVTKLLCSSFLHHPHICSGSCLPSDSQDMYWLSLVDFLLTTRFSSDYHHHPRITWYSMLYFENIEERHSKSMFLMTLSIDVLHCSSYCCTSTHSFTISSCFPAS